MIKPFRQLLIVVGKLLAFAIWAGVYQPVRLLGLLVDEISGTGPNYRQLRTMFQARPQLSASTFVKQPGVSPEGEKKEDAARSKSAFQKRNMGRKRRTQLVPKARSKSAI